VPDAKVMLFGSRANGQPTAESDWDILVLTKNKPLRNTKSKIQDKVFPISVEYATFISLMVVQEEEWNNNAGYYSMRKSIGNNWIQA
jgi:predicted nucleotidyltransferase